MFLMFLWLFCCFLVGIYAKSKKLSFTLFFVLSFFATPFVSYIAILIFGNK